MEQEIKRWFVLGRDCFENKEFLKAEKYFKNIISKKHEFADVYNMLGLIYHEVGKFTKAQKCFEKALALNPSYTEASLNLAVIYNDLGKYKEAKKTYLQAKKASMVHHGEIDPYIKGKLANMHSDIGDIYREVRLYEEAISEYKKALILRPKFIDIKTKLADTYRDQGNLDRAIKEYQDAKKISRKYSPVGLKLGILYYSQGIIRKAKAEWEDILLYDPNNKNAKMYLKLLEDISADANNGRAGNPKVTTSPSKTARTPKAAQKKTKKSAVKVKRKKTAS